MGKILFEYIFQMLFTFTYGSQILFLLTDIWKELSPPNVSSVLGRGKKNAPGVLTSLLYI